MREFFVIWIEQFKWSSDLRVNARSIEYWWNWDKSAIYLNLFAFWRDGNNVAHVINHTDVCVRVFCEHISIVGGMLRNIRLEPKAIDRIASVLGGSLKTNACVSISACCESWVDYFCDLNSYLPICEHKSEVFMDFKCFAEPVVSPHRAPHTATETEKITISDTFKILICFVQSVSTNRIECVCRTFSFDMDTRPHYPQSIKNAFRVC